MISTEKKKAEEEEKRPKKICYASHGSHHIDCKCVFFFFLINSDMKNKIVSMVLLVKSSWGFRATSRMLNTKILMILVVKFHRGSLPHMHTQ